MAERDDSLLVVEDDEATASFLADNLRADGFRVAVASGEDEGVRAMEVRRPDLVLLDLRLADGDGLRLLDRIRSADPVGARFAPDTPVLVLSGRAGELDRIRGLARGADDYVAKPFSYPELLARIRAVLRRSRGVRRTAAMRVGALVIDPVTRRVDLDGQPIHLSAKEFALLQALAVDPVRVCPKPELLRDVWGYMAPGRTRTVDAHACRLRRKLARDGGRYVHAVRGVGYRLVES